MRSLDRLTTRDPAESNLQALLDDTLVRQRRAAIDLQGVEVEDASDGTPGRLADLVSAFTTGSGSLLILGLSEERGFVPTDIDASALADAVESAYANDVEPSVRSDIDVCTVDGEPILVIAIDELPTDRKPCHVKSKGFERGVFVRTHDDLRSMTHHEIHLLIASRGQPKDDRSTIPDTGVADLDRRLVDARLKRLRSIRGPNFRDRSEARILEMALGRYPPQFFPQLDITFVVFPTVSSEPLAEDTRLLDNWSIDSSIPAMVSIALAAMRRNMKASIDRRGRRPGRPMGLPEGSIREDVREIDDHHAICENRGSGLLATATLLRRAGIPPPKLTGSVRQFVATVTNHGLPDEPTLPRCVSLDTHRPSYRQYLGLGFLK